MMLILVLVGVVILLVGNLILRVEQRRLSAQFDAAVEEARQAIFTTQALAASDRDMNDRLSASSTSILQATVRIEAAASHVATDLAASHERANAVTDGHPGEAADAALQKGEE
jgi:hypothetical protein